MRSHRKKKEPPRKEGPKKKEKKKEKKKRRRELHVTQSPRDFLGKKPRATKLSRRRSGSPQSFKSEATGGAPLRLAVTASKAPAAGDCGLWLTAHGLIEKWDLCGALGPAG